MSRLWVCSWGVRLFFTAVFVAYSISKAADPVVTAGAIPATPDDQTGLFPTPLTVSNPGPGAYLGIRVLVRDLPPDNETNAVRVYNAHGYTNILTTNNIAYFDFGPINAGASVQFTVEYYIRNRLTRPTPRYEVLVQAPPLPQLQTAFVINTNATRFVDGKFFAEFLTLRDQIYYVQYSSDVTSTNWATSLPAVVGTGQGVQWFDSGPPRTESKPTTVGSRFYRIVALP